ncbi:MULTISPECIES: hypothetical protein [Streptomyces]|uniref:hypothetical protein n=1 Tax=Streptomyces TaxID=1883 RepID=UPI0029AC9F57|nr:hypothetical protein [Streptomyces sp. ND04-05B]MDX3065371.1 hypothetical protein [Streptomyces sp. ND04-05B]
MPPESTSHAGDRLDDDDHPGHATGRVAEMIGAACRIVIPEGRREEAPRLDEELRRPAVGRGGAGS